ncbi:MAG TPA: alpha/beta hydrolase [Acidobacteriaceae bacterium]|jgi:pimeloyl-ACP methyl ester carboxylesterase|nr:alpha/beta hydrolase [Acidobacteriaceae bacterium]
MSLRPVRLFALAFLLVSSLAATAQQIPAAITTDPPIDKDHPASMLSFQIPSHGKAMNAIAYFAAGAGPHPTVFVLHGFPGNEKNLDLAQAIRRAGWNAIYFNYRGSWGTPGTFSFSNAIEDTLTAISWLREPANATKLHTDPRRIVLVGHSMGGFMAAYAGSHDPQIMATALISAANFHDWAGGDLKPEQEQANRARLEKSIADNDILPLAGCTAESLADEMLSHRKQWNFIDYAPSFGSRPLLVITSDDGLTAGPSRLAADLRKAGNSHVTEKHMATDHAYSDHRIELEATVLNWLATLK